MPKWQRGLSRKPGTNEIFSRCRHLVWSSLIIRKGMPGTPTARESTGKRIWSSYSKQKADPANDSPYGQSYIDIMIEVIQKVETRFEDPSFKLQSVSGYCKRLLKDKAKQMKFGALGGWYHTGLLDKDEKQNHVDGARRRGRSRKERQIQRRRP